jgi:hypothetical protein
MAGFTTILAWGAIDYEDAYVASGEINEIRAAIRWSTDYFIKVSFTLKKKSVRTWIRINFKNILLYLIANKRNNWFLYYISFKIEI